MSRKKAVDVADLLDLNLRLVKRRLLELEKMLDDPKADPFDRVTYMAKLNELSRTVTVLSAEERKRDTAVKKAVQKMTDEDRLELVKGFIAELAPGSRAELRALLESLEAGSVL